LKLQKRTIIEFGGLGFCMYSSQSSCFKYDTGFMGSGFFWTTDENSQCHV